MLTFAVLISGTVLLRAPRRAHDTVLFPHTATFILWFGAMTVPVLGHLADTARLAPRHWVPARDPVPGAGLRRAALVASLVVGAGLGLLALDQVDAWLRLRS